MLSHFEWQNNVFNKKFLYIPTHKLYYTQFLKKINKKRKILLIFLIVFVYIHIQWNFLKSRKKRRRWRLSSFVAAITTKRFSFFISCIARWNKKNERSTCLLHLFCLIQCFFSMFALSSRLIQIITIQLSQM